MRECQLLDLTEKHSRYYFTWGNGDSEDWQAKLQRVKASFSPDNRLYNTKTNLWSVWVNAENEKRLCEIFPNGRSALDCLRAQTDFLGLVDK